jgi:signal transduction histidine kinase
MQTVRRLARGDPGTLADAGLAIAAAVLTAVAAWAPAGLGGTRIAGPSWLLVLLPLLMGAPLALRRRAPLVMCTAIWAVIALQGLVTGHPPLGPYLVFVLSAGGYSLGAWASLRRAVAGLAVAAAATALISLLVWLASPGHPDEAGLGLSVIPLLAFWPAGAFVRARRQAAALAGRNAALQRLAEQAAADERARIARELHDIISHHLSVMVLLAAGARASGKATGAALENLENIENSGRQALAENRRLLDVLRDTGEETGLAPQPGIGELDTLAGSVRATGVPVNLVIDGDPAALPAAVDVSAYRIVQEALTNVLKHAGPARADVTICCARESVTIEITDNGTTRPAHQPPAGGHGLAGMRERAAVFGGQFHAGPRPGGGFTVRARLPLGDELP